MRNHNNTKGSIFLLLLLISISGLFSQNLINEYTTANTVGNGLTDLWINDIVVDQNGKVYFATRDGGISILSGDNWDRITVEDGMPSDRVQDLLIDSENALWVTNQTVSRWKNGQWTYSNEFSSEFDFIESVNMDRSGNLWLSTEEGMFKYDGTTATEMFSEMDFDDGVIFLEDSKGDYWVGKWNIGVYHYNGSGWTKYNQDNGLSHLFIRALVEDSTGNILVASNKGIDVFDGTSWSNQLNTSTIWDLYVAPSGEIWAGTSQGPYRYTENTWKWEDTGLEDRDRFARCFGMSEEGTLYVGRDYGYSTFTDSEWFHFTMTPGLGGISILDIMTTGGGDLWISSAYKNISIYKDGVWENIDVKKTLDCFRVYDMLEDEEGRIWLGSGSGIRKYDGNDWTSYDREEGLAHPRVYNFLQARDGKIWAGTVNGVCWFDNETWICLDEADGLVHNDVRDLCQDRNGNFWFATSEGLSRYDGVNWTNFTTDNGLSRNFIQVIYEDRKGNIWIGTSGGVDRYDGSNWVSFNQELNYRNVYDIIETPGNHLWFAGVSGLGHFDGNSMQILQSTQITDLTSLATDSIGRLWVGTDEAGVLVLDNLTTSTNNFSDLSSSVRIYPNPVTDRLYIKVNGKLGNTRQVAINNILGQTVLKKNYARNHGLIEMNLFHLPNGTYFVTIHDGLNIESRKFVVSK